MSVTLKPYPEYKDSGVPWLGKIPKHWQALPNRILFTEMNDRNHPEEPLLSVTISKGVIRQADLLADTSKKDSSNENKANYKLVQPRDIAYNKMRAWQGAVGASNYRGIVSPAYIVVRLRGEQNPEYFHYLLRTPAFAKEAERWSYGITSDQWSLRAEDFKQIYCSLPPKEEQDAIVAFLAHADHYINRLIHAKRRLIELLNEQKQVTIYNAVTGKWEVRRVKSENGEIISHFTPRPSHFMKPSGIDWLGDVPEHWDILKLKFVVDARGGMTPSKTEAHFWTGEIPWVSPKDMKVREIRDSIDHISQEAVEQTGIALIEPPAVLIVVRGMILARTFPVAVTSVPVTINQDMKALRPKPSLDPWFLCYLLMGIQRQILALTEEAGHGTQRLRTDLWANLPIPIPRSNGQQHIMQHLESELLVANDTIDRARREIDLLREYRTRLIADVVTGKLDVRNVKFEGGREKEEEDATWFEDENVEDLDEGAEERGDDE